MAWRSFGSGRGEWGEMDKSRIKIHVPHTSPLAQFSRVVVTGYPVLESRRVSVEAFAGEIGTIPQYTEARDGVTLTLDSDQLATWLWFAGSSAAEEVERRYSGDRD
jgi:hypothetical protein